MCSALSFPIARFTSTRHIFESCPSSNLKAFERQQLYVSWPYVGSCLSWPCGYNPIYSASNVSFSKVHFTLDVRVYGSFRCLFLLMKSISSSHCLTSVYVACSWVGNRTISLPFDTEQITTMDIVFGNLGTILLTLVITRCRKSVTGRLLPRLPCFLTIRISLPHFFKHISTHCRRIQSELWKLFKGNQVSHVSKQSATPVSQCRGLSLSCFN
jgi:hypothetical protein